MNTTMTRFLCSDPAMYTSPGSTYARVGIRDPARMYVSGRIYFLAPWPLYVHVHATCVPLLRHVRSSTTTRTRLYIDQYVRTRSRPERQCYVRFDQVGPDCQAIPCVQRCSWWVRAVRGVNRFFCPDALPCMRRCSWWVPAVREETFFFTKYGGSSGGSLLSGGGIIILCVIRRHFLAAAV